MERIHRLILGCVILLAALLLFGSCKTVQTIEKVNYRDSTIYNFREYIALRLTDNGSGLTLTLSQEVRNAIHAAEDEYGIENIIITQKGWTISPAPN